MTSCAERICTVARHPKGNKNRTTAYHEHVAADVLVIDRRRVRRNRDNRRRRLCRLHKCAASIFTVIHRHQRCLSDAWKVQVSRKEVIRGQKEVGRIRVRASCL